MPLRLDMTLTKEQIIDLISFLRDGDEVSIELTFRNSKGQRFSIFMKPEDVPKMINKVLTREKKE
jgi:hypothetical protein